LKGKGAIQRDEQAAKIYVEVAEVYTSLKWYAITGERY
jgi:hypothetical protein